MMKQCILMLTHIMNKDVWDRFKKLKTETSSIADCFLYCSNNNDVKSAFSKLINTGYNPISDTIVPGSPWYSLAQFYLDHKDYDYYWYVEYDAVFNGNWNDFFLDFSDEEADLVASYIELYDDNRNWCWWDIEVNMPYELKDRVKSFNPVMRLSNKALKFLDAQCSTGISGHYEVLIPTVLYNNGFELLDFGGEGRFTPKKFINKYYTCKIKPYNYWHIVGYTTDELVMPNMLYHPIKCKNDG